ncbi:F-box/LRR-repeat protein 17 [Dorcoceras hygrometricum]|uniref:F-box/LRR-repeat protein 17 n=1 Tax=Dorcoceras hygrometricum TaxID=472368 RepID=A0A2Z7ASX0_9LAMI|nr:F-box/LRR-repeat protein 17 [Dorcoceras hygrometricum]
MPIFTDNNADVSTPLSATTAVEASDKFTCDSDATLDNSTLHLVRPIPPGSLRRALSFDDESVIEEELEEEEGMDSELDLESAKLPASCLWTRRFWRAAVELRLNVEARTQFGFVGSVLQKCTGLVKPSLRFGRLASGPLISRSCSCIAFSCPSLQSLDIFTFDSSVNRITGGNFFMLLNSFGDELSRFIAQKKFLASLKMEGSCNLGSLMFSSTSLSSICLSDLQTLSKTVFNFPNLREISFAFSWQENDRTDITSIKDALGRSCPKLKISTLFQFGCPMLQGLRMLSLVFGSEITDASVAAIVSSFTKLELLDLSGSSISDSGIGMICNVYPGTLLKLLLALCPNNASSGIQFAAAQLPHLDLMDCGMTICDPNPEKPTFIVDLDKICY